MTSFSPAIELEHDRQIYRATGTREHVNRRGETMLLLEWASECPTCGSGFLVATLPRLSASTFAHLRRRCDACKAPGRPVHPRKACADANG